MMAKELKKLPMSQNVTKSGHTASNTQMPSDNLIMERTTNRIVQGRLWYWQVSTYLTPHTSVAGHSRFPIFN